MPPRAMELYGDYIPRMRRIVEMTAARGIPAARVADAVEHALTAARPKTRYLVGNDARAQTALRAVPDKGRDAMVARFLGLNKRS